MRNLIVLSGREAVVPSYGILLPSGDDGVGCGDGVLFSSEDTRSGTIT